MTTRSRNCLRDVMSPEQEKDFHERILEKIIANPRRYLDNLESYDTYRLSFQSYNIKSYVKSPKYIPKKGNKPKPL